MNALFSDVLELQCQLFSLRYALPTCSGFLSELGPFYPTSDGELEASPSIQMT